MKLKELIIAVLTICILTNSLVRAAEKKVAEAKPGKGMTALKQAAAANKYLFVFFWKAEDENTKAMRKVFDGTLKKISGKANPVAVKVTEATEKDIVGKFRVENAPMPLVLAVAPNGMVTRGFPYRFTAEQLESAIISPLEMKCMGILQAGKLLFICIQDKTTTKNKEALKGVNDFIADGFKDKAEVLTISPADEQTKEFLKKMGMLEIPKEATTLFLTPPGQIKGVFKGATTKEEIKKANCRKGCC